MKYPNSVETADIRETAGFDTIYFRVVNKYMDSPMIFKDGTYENNRIMHSMAGNGDYGPEHYLLGSNSTINLLNHLKKSDIALTYKEKQILDELIECAKKLNENRKQLLLDFYEEDLIEEAEKEFKNIMRRD